MTDSLIGLVEEQHSVRSSLLDHFCVDVVAVCPCVGVFVVGVGDQAREVGLLVARGRIVETEEEDGHGNNRSVETRLYPLLVTALEASLRAIVPGFDVRRSSRYRKRCGERHQRCGWRDGAESGFVHHAQSAGLLFEGVAWCISRPMAFVRLVC